MDEARTNASTNISACMAGSCRSPFLSKLTSPGADRFHTLLRPSQSAANAEHQSSTGIIGRKEAKQEAIAGKKAEIQEGPDPLREDYIP